MGTTKGPEVSGDLTLKRILADWEAWKPAGGLVIPDNSKAEAEIILAKRQAMAKVAASQATAVRTSSTMPVRRERIDVHAAVVSVADRLGIKDPGYRDIESYAIQPQTVWLMCQILGKILDKANIGLPGDVSHDLVEALLKGQEDAGR